MLTLQPQLNVSGEKLRCNWFRKMLTLQLVICLSCFDVCCNWFRKMLTLQQRKGFGRGLKKIFETICKSTFL